MFIVFIVYGFFFLVFTSVPALLIYLFVHAWRKRTRLYNKTYCRGMITKYTGDKNDQVLRALTSGELRPSDIKRYYNSGESTWSGTDERYRLIRRINTSEYTVIKYLSGSTKSRLGRIEIDIKDGKGTIIEHWYCD